MPSPTFVFLLSSLLLSAASAQAQAQAQTRISAQLESQIQLKVTAVDTYNIPQSKTAPANTVVNGNLSLKVSPGFNAGSASFLAEFDGTPSTGWRARITESAGGFAGKPAGTGPHTLLLTLTLTLTNSKPATVRIIVGLKASASPQGAYVAAVDLGADGSVEFMGDQKSSTSSTFLTTLGPKGLPIEIFTAGLAAPGGFTANLSIQVLPLTGCTIAEFGKGCRLGKPKMVAGVDFDHELELKLSGAFPFDAVVLGVGNQNLSLPLPSLTDVCLQHTDILAHLVSQTDIKGNLLLRIPIPVGLKANVNLQMFTVTRFGPALDIRSTKAVTLV